MEGIPTPFEALEMAVSRSGSQSALARICNVSQPAVWKWLQSAKRLPGRHALAVEAATGVPKEWLAPNFYPAELTALPASAIGEEAPLCGPILSVHALAKYGNLAKYMDEREVAA